MSQMDRYAFIDEDNKAVNFIESDGPPGYVPEGCTAVIIPEGPNYGFGWIWNGTSFDNPNPEPGE